MTPANLYFEISLVIKKIVISKAMLARNGMTVNRPNKAMEDQVRKYFTWGSNCFVT